MRIENLGSQIAAWHRNRLARPEAYLFESAEVLAEGDFAFRAAVNVVENDPGNAPLRQGAKVIDVDYPGQWVNGRSRRHTRIEYTEVPKAVLRRTSHPNVLARRN